MTSVGARPHEGPSLLLERDAGDVVGGTVFILEDDQVIVGDAPGVDGIRVGGAGLTRRHLRLTQKDGGWFVADVHGVGRPGGARDVVTLVNGVALDAVDSEPRALRDDDRIAIKGGADGVVVFVFKDRGRLITGVSVRGRPGEPDGGGGADQSARHVTFCPWHRYPLLSYAMSADDDRVRTAIEPATQWFVGSGLGDVPDAPRIPVHVHVDGVQIVDDIHGIFLGDLVRHSQEESATIDVSVLLEVARLAASVPSGLQLRSRALLTFSGAIVWFGVPASQQSAVLRQGVVQQLLATLGCKPFTIGAPAAQSSSSSAAEALREQRAALVDAAAVAIDAEARSALLRLVDVAIDEPARIADALGEAAASTGGPPSRDAVRGLVTNLFPSEHARHLRVMEEAQLLGFRGIAALAAPPAGPPGPPAAAP